MRFVNKIVMDLQISVNSDQSLSYLGLHYLLGRIRQNVEGIVNVPKFQTLFSFCSPINYWFSRLEFTKSL